MPATTTAQICEIYFTEESVIVTNKSTLQRGIHPSFEVPLINYSKCRKALDVLQTALAAQKKARKGKRTNIMTDTHWTELHTRQAQGYRLDLLLCNHPLEQVFYDQLWEASYEFEAQS